MKDKLIDVPDTHHNLCPNGLGYLFFEAMKKYETNIAQIDVKTGAEDTYSEFSKRCIRTAIELKRRGVTRKDIIVLNTNNHFNANVPFIASHFLGCRIASLDPSIAVEDARHLLHQVEPRIIFTNVNAETVVLEASDKLPTKPEIVVFGTPDFEQFIIPKDGERDFVPDKVDPNDTAVILFSSGSTGLPKGICCSHRMMAKAGLEFLCGIDISRILYYSSLYWISGVMCTIDSVYNGVTRLIVPSFNPAEFWTLVPKFKATVVFAAPTHIVQIIKNKPDHVSQMETLKATLVGGGPAPIEYIMELQKAIPNTIISQFYGQSELGIVTRFLHTNPTHLELLKKNPKSCGLIVGGFSAKICDPETNERLGPNKIGEIRIRTIYQLNGYHNLDSKNVWDSEGFVCTGDLAYYDDDFCIYYVDRLKEMLKYQSWHITPVKIESIILKHPAVSAAVVIGIPHDEDGDHALALVVLREECGLRIKDRELQKFVDDQLDDRHKLRGGLMIMNTLLYTPSGKFRRTEMRNLILSGAKTF